MSLVLALVLAAAQADVDRCRAALARVTSHEAPERIDAFQACGGLLGDQGLKGAWFAVVHTSPFDAAMVLMGAAAEPVPGALQAPNACARAKSEAAICKANRAEVQRLSGEERHRQWRALFMKLLEVDLPAAQALQLQTAFSEKWPMLFPLPPPPGMSNDGPLRVSGNIDRVAVLRGIGQVRRALDACVARLNQGMVLKWVVTPQGKVTEFAVVDPSEPEPVACLTRAFKSAPMPKPVGGGAAVIVWTSEQQ